MPPKLYPWSLRRASDWYGRIDGLPTRPYETRSFSSSIDLTSRSHGSDETRQAIAADGKEPHLCPDAKRDEPSALYVSVRR